MGLGRTEIRCGAIEDDTREGWAWWELKNVQAPRVELDALRLIAVFLAHWDNKADNQRLVCMDKCMGNGQPCRDSVLMIQDVGATFGRRKSTSRSGGTCRFGQSVRRAPCRCTRCRITGATFADARISEAARIRGRHPSSHRSPMPICGSGSPMHASRSSTNRQTTRRMSTPGLTRIARAWLRSSLPVPAPA
jgi:hypothetical protein